MERTTSKAKIELISRVWSSCLQDSQSCRELDPRKRSQHVPRSRTRIPALPKARTQAMDQQSITGNAQATRCNTWHDMRDGICNAYACSGKENDETRHQLGKPSMLLER